MQLNGALSNPQLLLESSLERLTRVRKRLLSRPLVASVGVRRLPPRVGRVSLTVSEVLRRADAPMRAKDVHRACEIALGEAIPLSTVYACLSAHSRSRRPRFVRVAIGLYALVQPNQ